MCGVSETRISLNTPGIKVTINASPKASRIDFILISRGLDDKVENIMHAPSTLTDHSSIFIHLSTDMNKRGVGYWKLSTVHLNKAEYKLFLMKLRV